MTLLLICLIPHKCYTVLHIDNAGARNLAMYIYGAKRFWTKAQVWTRRWLMGGNLFQGTCMLSASVN